MLPKVQDISQQTQQFIQGPVTAWQHHIKKPGFWSWLLGLFGQLSRREFIAAPNLDQEMLLFQRKSPIHSWDFVNISQITNQPADSKACGWTDRGLWFTSKKENIAAKSPTGDLILFRGKGSIWTRKNLSSIVNQKITGVVTRWFHQGKQHLAGIAPGNQLVVFSGSGSSWTVENISQNTGINILDPVTSWLTRNGPAFVPHLAGRNPAGDLIVFWLSMQGNWRSVNVSDITGKQISGGPCSWKTRNGPYLVEHLSVKGLNGESLVFWWSPQHDWQAVDVTRIVCQEMHGVPAVYQLRDDDGQNAEVVAFRSSQNKLFIQWWKPSFDWLLLNLSDAVGEPIHANPDCWTSYSQRYRRNIEYAAVQGGDYRLLLFSLDRKPRKLVEHLVKPYFELERIRGVIRDLLIIMWDWHDPAWPRPARDVLDDVIFGAADSVKDYFREVSHGHFSINKVDLLGWYDADHPHTYYQDTNDAGDSNQDGFINQHHIKYKEGVRKAHEAGFPFANYDANQDGRLALQELPMILIVPGGGGRGFVRNINEVEYPNVQRLTLNGLEFDSLVEIYSTTSPSIGIYAHELGHIFLGQGDMYWELPAGTFMKYAPGAYSVMDQHGRSAHYDPFSKIKLGWVSPRLVLKSGWYDISAVESSYKAWVLMDPTRGKDEYFIIENRWTSNTYEQSLPDAGVGIWQIIEDPQLFNALPCPTGMDPTIWANTQVGHQWSRLGVRMIRPHITSFNDHRALWDGSDPLTGYDLLSSDPDPTHNELRWADGSPSGFSIKNIPAASDVMRIRIEVPF